MTRRRGSGRLTRRVSAEEVGGPQARRPLPRPPAAPGRGPARRPGRLAGDRLPGLAGGAAGRRVLERRRAQRRDDHERSASTTSRTLFDEPVYRDVALRTIRIAALVTVTDALLAFPIAFYMAKLAGPQDEGGARRRGPDAALVLLPGQGLRLAHDALRGRRAQLGARPDRPQRPGFGTTAVWLVESYLWLPFMILPIYAGLERIPDSLLSASEDLGANPAHHLPPRDPAARLPRRGRGLDLHLLAHARRLHRPVAGLAAPSSSATSSSPASPTTSRSPPRSRSCRSW